MFAVVLGSYAFAIDDRQPEQIVEDTSSKILKTINEENDRLREDPTLINGLINETVIPIIDLDSMGKLILGKYWKRASEAQRTSFVAEFKDMLIRTYAKSLVDYGHAKVNVLPARDKEQGKYYTVQSELDVGSGKAPLQVAYIFRKNKQTEWKVFDLAVDGLSLVKNFRTSFSQEIRETSLDALIARLANTNKSGATDEVVEEVAE
ncbi:MAG: ABC transporter substrate-binding protein [Gammaproteobacteria bacterium]|nr:ABC transporter substrate-binding protein [Gammaproteobacteria bacterium]NNC67817.1 ABC transporter substrate-binding protein [Gammaproteobacteria bacterium]